MFTIYNSPTLLRVLYYNLLRRGSKICQTVEMSITQTGIEHITVKLINSKNSLIYSLLFLFIPPTIIKSDSYLALHHHSTDKARINAKCNKFKVNYFNLDSLSLGRHPLNYRRRLHWYQELDCGFWRICFQQNDDP